jgi:hypothetical protein
LTNNNTHSRVYIESKALQRADNFPGETSKFHGDAIIIRSLGNGNGFGFINYFKMLKWKSELGKISLCNF